ncbi:hypothetical protein HJC23_007718 [Cyclotella cryptica]|uniref:Rab-GAP TBC domain-containing protein n=1 Tax=Cyclotella cryptica TaxID=29204 RepID=A0ABD3PAE9_9STRA|eukprot:CCRYP_016402-RA/>CCRYP_016402-RA protein AED:0.13 eAED:0.13 QI:816/1/1/1/1/1/3/135/686
MMQPINETSALKSSSKTTSKLGASMKNPLGLFKRGKKSDYKASHSVSNDSSLEHCTKVHIRSSSVSLSDADEEKLLVDKFGFIINAEGFNQFTGEASNPEKEKASGPLGDFRSFVVNLSPEKPELGSKREWTSMVGLDSIMLTKEGAYDSLVEKSQNNDGEAQPGEEHRTEWDAIERDLRRTFPNHSMFREEEEDSRASNDSEPKEGQTEDPDGETKAQNIMYREPYGKQALRRILRAYSLYDTEVGYCQGMNFIAGMLLTFLSEEVSFWLLVVIMNDEPYKLREIFNREMAGTHEVLYIADKLVQVFLPELYAHLEKQTVHTSMFSTQWLMTIYTSTFPFDLVTRVWDLFLSEGWKIVYKTFIALLVHAREDGDLINKNMEEILSYLRHFQSKVDGEKIMTSASKIPLKHRHIQKYASEFRKLMEGGEMHVHEVIQRFLTFDDSTIASANSQLKKVHRFIRLKKQSDVSVQDFSPKMVPVAFEAKLAVMISDALSPEECAELIQRAKDQSYDDVLIRQDGMKASQHVAKCSRAIVKDFDLAEELFQRIMDALENIPELAEKFVDAPWMKKKVDTPLRATGVNDNLHFLKFGVGESIAPLRDSTVTRGNETSCVTMHVYLNDNFKGGVTSFKGDRRYFDIKPKMGSILIFDQDLRHEECEVTKGKRYFMRTDVMYSPRPVIESTAQ